MLFNELIEQHGLETVVSATNISSINLNYLLQEDFKKLNRVKALGFLLILEREYPDIDVTDLRQTIKLYFENNLPADDKVVMVPKDSTTGGGGFSFFKLFIILAILGGGYYLYTQGRLNSLVEKVEKKETFFNDNKALESNSTEADAKKVVVGKSQTDSVHINTSNTLNQTESKITSKQDNNISKASSVHTEESTKATESNKSIESAVQEVSKAFLAKEGNKSQESNISHKTESITTPITTISINPTRGMLWYGFINLDTKKRREFMKKVSTPFKINNGRWLLVTGHGYVDIVSEAKTVENADNKKHYFLIDSTDIKEIDKKEFRRLNGHRGW